MEQEFVLASRLDSIQDWEERAKRAAYHVSALAAACGVSPRQLQRFIRCRFGKPPRDWLAEQRLSRAAGKLQQQALVKEAAVEAGFSPSHFTRRFTRHYGQSPTAFRATSQAQRVDVRFGQEMSDSDKSNALP